MMFRPDRVRRGRDRTLLARMAIFAAGAVIALGGIIWEQSILVWIAIALLAGGMALSIYGRRSSDSTHGDSES